MKQFLILLLIFLCSQYSFAQVDEIVLPEIDLVIEDQSAINTQSSVDAILKERTPQFQQVYLDELSTGIEESFINSSISSPKTLRQFFVEISYGSFNNTQFKTFAQNSHNNFYYTLFYQGQFRGNSALNNVINRNSDLFNNLLNLNMTGDFTNTIVQTDIGYQQEKISLNNLINDNQYTHYIPIALNVRHWINANSYFDVKTSFETTLLSFLDLQGILTRDAILFDGIIDAKYVANFVEWNFFEVEVVYALNAYPNELAHTGNSTIKSEFKLGKGFALETGFTVGGSTTCISVFGWPEIALTYAYLNYFELDFRVSGDHSLLDAKNASEENQFFAQDPFAEWQWIYSGTIKITPSPYFWSLMQVSYHDYQNKRLYSFDPQTQLYSFMNSGRVGVIGVIAEIGVDVPKIFNLSMAYVFEQVRNTWLLCSPHKFNVTMNLGYSPVGFNFQTVYSFYAPRNLTDTVRAPMIHLLNMRISQKIYKIAELFIEVNNILNQKIQFTSETHYGGIQANGGVKLSF